MMCGWKRDKALSKAMTMKTERERVYLPNILKHDL